MALPARPQVLHNAGVRGTTLTPKRRLPGGSGYGFGGASPVGVANSQRSNRRLAVGELAGELAEPRVQARVCGARLLRTPRWPDAL